MKKDTVWWYASVRSLDSSVRYTNFPVKPHETHLGNFTTQGHLSAVAEQQADRLLPAQHEGAEEPARPAAARRARPRFTSPTMRASGRTTARCCGRRNGTRCCRPRRSSKFARGQFGYSWPDTPNGTGVSYEDLNTSIVSGKARARQLEHPAHPGAGLAQLLQERLGGQPQLQGRVASGSARRARLSGSPARTTTCCTCFAAAWPPK